MLSNLQLSLKAKVLVPVLASSVLSEKLSLWGSRADPSVPLEYF